MAQKKELTEQEKVALILKKAGVKYDPKKAEAQIALNTRCKRCGHTLSSLERVVFNDKCAKCMQEETTAKRDNFVKKYIIIAFAFIASLIIGAYCASPAASSSKGWQIGGAIFSAIVTGISLVYVLYTNMDKVFPRIPQKAQAWCCFITALIVDFVLCLLIVLVKSWVFYFLLMLAVGAYLAYVAYTEYNSINEKYNLIAVFNRKSRDKDYVESITEALENRAQEEEVEAVEEAQVTVAEEVADDAVSDIETAPETVPTVVETTAATDEKTAPPQREIKADNIHKTEAAEESDDSGDFSI